MQITIRPSFLSGTIQSPASKSSMQRACAASLLSPGETVIENPGHSNDDLAALGVIEGLGSNVNQIQGGAIEVISSGVRPLAEEVNCGESGLAIRMFAPIVALSDKRIVITGQGSLLNRPMNFFDDVLPQLGVEIRSHKGRLPLEIKGPLQPKNISIDGSLSSQFLTGLLMAYSASRASAVTIQVNGLKSKPYVDLTLKVMKDFGMPVPDHSNYETFYFSGVAGPASQKRIYRVEGDWSGAAFLLVAGVVSGKVNVLGLDLQSRQADKAILDALRRCGAILEVQEGSIKTTSDFGNRGDLRPFEFDATECPDLFPPLVALACYCRGTSVLKGTDRLLHKESNRALTLQEEFRKMDVDIEIRDDRMLVSGGNPVKGSRVHSRHDHRIAMACAVAALGATGETTIQEAQAIDKSYPDFFENLRSLGAVLNTEITVDH
jgi:3-phosphoshikimate 1-carboxyvinyltransferase